MRNSFFKLILITLLSGLISGVIIGIGIITGISYFLKERGGEMNIVFSIDDNYAPHTAASILSILDHANKSDNIHFYIILSNASNETKQKLSQIKSKKNFSMSFIDLQRTDFPNIPSYMFNPVNARLILPDIFPTVDKVLYLDGDTIVLNSLAELYHQSLPNIYAAVVSDTTWSVDYRVKELGLSKYFNSGVILLNLKKMRKDKLIEKFIEAHHKLYMENKIIWEDQDILNFVFDENVLFMPQRFNLLAHDIENFPKNEVQNPIIIHYTSCKPWKTNECNYNAYYEKYVRQSPFSSSMRKLEKTLN